MVVSHFSHAINPLPPLIRRLIFHFQLEVIKYVFLRLSDFPRMNIEFGMLLEKLNSISLAINLIERAISALSRK